MGWGGFLDRVTSWLPIQSRKERWRNKIEDLKREKERLMADTCDAKKANRIVVINRELDRLNQLLKNN